MSTMTAENILSLYAQLPPVERIRFRQLIEQQEKQERQPNEQPARLPRDKRLPPKPMPPGSMEAMDWIAEHRREYAGQWVALDGARLIAASPNHDEVWAAADADGAVLPLFHYFDDPDKIYAGF